MRNYNVNNLYFSSVNNIYTFLDQMALIRVQFPAKYVHYEILVRTLPSTSVVLVFQFHHSLYRIKCCNCPIFE